MKLYLTKLLLLFSLFLAFTGCKKNFVISDRQVILFELKYVNYAWGYQHRGFLIDNEGNVLSYNNPEGWNFPDSEYRLNEKQVGENISRCTHTGIRIPKTELNKYSGYIKNIASSKVTALKDVAADAGSTEYICYQFSENSGTYKGYIIKMEGDFTCENLNFYSKRVAEWMKNINDTIAVR